jgi:hypothetical protein
MTWGVSRLILSGECKILVQVYASEYLQIKQATILWYILQKEKKKWK